MRVQVLDLGRVMLALKAQSPAWLSRAPSLRVLDLTSVFRLVTFESGDPPASAAPRALALPPGLVELYLAGEGARRPKTCF